MRYLYKNNKEVYSVELNREKIIEYKKEKMKNISEEERIFSSISFDKDNSITDKMDRFYVKISPRKNKIFYLYKSKLDERTKDNILELYYNGIFVNLKCFKSDYLGETKYYLVDIPNNKINERKTFGSIIQVPKELYDLQLLLNEEYNLLNKDAIENIKELLTLRKVRELNYKVDKPNHNTIIRKLTRK